jgi:glucose/arabinose dehydrogenase
MSLTPFLRGRAGAMVATTLLVCLFTGCTDPTRPGSPAPVTTSATVAASAGPTSTNERPVPSGTTGDGPPSLRLEPYVDGLDRPVDLAVRPAEPVDLYVVEQVGRIRRIHDGQLESTPTLDIAGMVIASGEQGMLGLAFHPDPTDDRFFVYYTGRDGSEVVSAFRMDPDTPGRAQPDSEQVLLRMDDPYANHNGGGMVFGPDGYLYISTGDGGGGGDPLGSGRSLDTLLAKVLRIDVDAVGGDGTAYGIPPDNPFVGTVGARPEIWLTGLRNPWRIRFDRATGDLWIGDVGQGAWEEIDIAPAGIGGLDFGWNIMEGTHCYAAQTCASGGLTPPVTEYGHDLGCAVTGGTVYRGTAQPSMSGWYVFADYCTGRTWVIDAAAAAERPQDPILVLEARSAISAIAEDGSGELFATALRDGAVLRMVAESAPGD